MLLSEALHYGMKRLKTELVIEYKSDASLLLEHCTGIDFRTYFLHQQKSLTKEEEEQYQSYLERRIKGEPVQYITNKAYLMGYEFYVDENVLIPRYDTEILVAAVLNYIKPGMRLLDLCTGSGCILISVLKETKDVIGVGSDISKEALEVAKKNAIRHGCRLKLLQGDLFEPVTGLYDIIVSNPPYVNRKDMESLEREVGEYEPHLALFGGEDGLDYYKRIIKDSLHYLAEGGRLFLEIAYDQLDKVSDLMKLSGFVDIFSVKDFNHIDRVLYARKGKKWA